jgi:hypothetical protein
MPPLELIDAVHVRVICDGCGHASAEVCGKRELATAARAMATHKFHAFGWHQDPATHRDREHAMAMRDGTGRWYCPACARKTHL